MSYDPNKPPGSTSPPKEMDPEKVAHIVDVVNAVRLASRDLPEDVRRGLIERREEIRRSKAMALQSLYQGRRRRF